MGSLARPNEVVLLGKGGTAERLSFSAKPETKDAELVTTRGAGIVALLLSLVA